MLANKELPSASTKHFFRWTNGLNLCGPHTDVVIFGDELKPLLCEVVIVFEDQGYSYEKFCCLFQHFELPNHNSFVYDTKF